MAAKEEIKVKVQQKTEKGKDEKDDGVINAVYKVNLHCDQCAREIKKPLLRTQGPFFFIHILLIFFLIMCKI